MIFVYFLANPAILLRMVWRKTYISTANQTSFRTDLPEILKISRALNTASGLTGVLLVARGSYYQTLEGAKPDIDATYRRIRSDPRHDGLIILQDEAAEGRAFANWSMAHRDLPPDHRIAGLISQIAAGQAPAARTNIPAAELDILIASFLTV